MQNLNRRRMGERDEAWADRRSVVGPWVGRCACWVAGSCGRCRDVAGVRMLAARGRSAARDRRVAAPKPTAQLEQTRMRSACMRHLAVVSDCAHAKEASRGAGRLVVGPGPRAHRCKARARHHHLSGASTADGAGGPHGRLLRWCSTSCAAAGRHRPDYIGRLPVGDDSSVRPKGA